MPLNRYLSVVLLLGSALVTQYSSAADLIYFDVGDPDNIKMSDQQAAPKVNNDDYDAQDGVTFLNILAEDADVSSDIVDVAGNLKASGVDAIGPYDSVETDSDYEGFPRSLNLYHYDSPADIQDFDTSTPAFTGTSQAAPSFKDNFILRRAGATGDIVSGYEEDDVSEVIGQWRILDSTLEPGTIVLEEPVDGQVVGGIGNLRGFAFFQVGVAKVEIYIDGEYAFDAPYGGSRTDVGDAFPDYEEAGTSGFSLAFGYSNLTPGEHTVIARAIDVGGDPFGESQSTFTVVAFKETFIYSNQPVDGTMSEITMSGDEIDITQIQVGDNVYDLKLKWRTAEQGFEIVVID